jgi:hypothetical protein
MSRNEKYFPTLDRLITLRISTEKIIPSVWILLWPVSHNKKCTFSVRRPYSSTALTNALGTPNIPSRLKGSCLSKSQPITFIWAKDRNGGLQLLVGEWKSVFYRWYFISIFFFCLFAKRVQRNLRTTRIFWTVSLINRAYLNCLKRQTYPTGFW